MSEKSKKVDPAKKLDRLATELGTTIKGMTPRQKQQYVKQGQTGKTKKRDRIDILVDALDKYHFRLGSADNELRGTTYIHGSDWRDNILGLFESKRLEKARRLIDNQKEGVWDAACDWVREEQEIYTLLGFVLGLRIAGIPSENAKAMARTWRLGYPQDDRKGGRR
jgi:hypothetical protein